MKYVVYEGLVHILNVNLPNMTQCSQAIEGYYSTPINEAPTCFRCIASADSWANVFRRAVARRARQS